MRRVVCACLLRTRTLHGCTYAHASESAHTHADGDDVDPEAGEWELLFIVQRPCSPCPRQDAVALVGYLTIYAFNNPLKGKGLRICQALVLPPFQRQGT